MANINTPNRRALQDANLFATTLAPAAGSNANSAAFDLQAGDALGQPYSASEHFSGQIDVDAFPNSTSTTNNYSFVFQDSADNATFANIAEMGTVTVPGVASTGSASSLATFGGIDQVKFPPSTRRYVRAQSVATAGTGSNITANWYFSIRF